MFCQIRAGHTADSLDDMEYLLLASVKATLLMQLRSRLEVGRYPSRSSTIAAAVGVAAIATIHRLLRPANSQRSTRIVDISPNDLSFHHPLTSLGIPLAPTQKSLQISFHLFRNSLS